MSKEFAHHAVVRPNFQMSPEERLRHSLENPGAQHAMSMRAATGIAKARIAYNLSEMSVEMLEEAKGWLRQVAAVSPKAGVELFLQLLEFSTPKLKAVEVNMEHTERKAVKDMSLAELDEALGVVSVQHAPEPPKVEDLL